LLLGTPFSGAEQPREASVDLAQRPELKQKVTLSPQVYQGLNILAMPVAELQAVIEQELLENPVLELDSLDEAPEDEAEEERLDEGSEEERAWDEWLDQYEDLDDREPVVPRDPNEEAVNTEEFVGAIVSFEAYLVEQLSLLDIDDELEHAARMVIGSLDGDGLLVASAAEIAAVAGVTPEIAEDAIAVVQKLDPPGVGARNLAEALKIQLAVQGIEEPLLERIIDEHLADVAANHYRKIARAVHVDEAEVRRLVGILKMLNPRPAGAYSPGPSPGYIVPDVTLRRFGDEWLIMSNNDAVPTLRVVPSYRNLLRSGSSADDDTRRYLKDKIRAAESFIRNVERRKDTVGRIAGIILEVQHEFFEDGKGPLVPLRLEDVAVEIGVHLSTVSRGVTGKYMATPYGLYELKHFFSGGYRTASGVDVAATTVKARLKELLLGEDPEHPLSDQRLAHLLAEEGVTVARRTVAKYREELGIEPSWVRKRR
jgi:RNA polymerase sigma-54 factor